MAKHHHDHERQQFDASLQQAGQALATAPPDEGGAAGLSLKGFWSFLATAVTDPAVRDLLWSLFQRRHGGTTEPTPQSPEPPPEPVA